MWRTVFLLAVAAFASTWAAESDRRIWADRDREALVAISPDGQHLVSVESASGITALWDETPGGERRHILEHREQINSVFVLPDNRILFTTGANGGGAALHSVDVNGSHERRVATFPQYSFVVVTDVAPDGNTLAALTWAASPREQRVPPQLAILSARTGTAHQLLTTNDWILAGGFWKFSPDGRYVVGCRRMEKNLDMSQGRRRQIFRVAVKDGVDSPLIDEQYDVFPVAWTHEGLLFARDLFNRTDLWLQPLRGDVPGGPARLMRTGLGRISPIGMTREGVLFCYRTQFGTDLYLADLDLARGTLSKARHATTSEGDRWPLWSPDGRHVVFYSRLHSGSIYNFNAIRILDPPGEPRELTQLNGFYTWLSDGSLLITENKGNRLTPYRFDPVTLKVTPGAPFPNEAAEGEDLGYLVADRKGVLYYRSDARHAIMSRNLDGSNPKVLFGLPGGTFARALRMSPDRARIAFVLVDDRESNGKWQAIMLIDTDGTNPRELFRVESPVRIQSANGHGISWGPNGEGILFTRGEKDIWSLWYVPLADGKLRQIQIDINGERELRTTYPWMDMSPDRKTLVFDHGIENRPQLWAIGGLVGDLRQ